MLGWNIAVYQQKNDGRFPALFGDEKGKRLAVWQTGLGGLKWINELVIQRRAINLGGNGYPYEYTAISVYIIPFIRESPPEAKPIWSFDSGDIILTGWLGKTTLDLEAMQACSDDEWLIIQVWDES